MKYVIIIPDGAADQPLDVLGGRTAFQAAYKPNTDRLSLHGRQGTVATTPEGFPCGSDVCSMSLLGYSPAKYHRGRAPLEAAALGIPIKPTDWIFRLNLINVTDGKIEDHSAGHINSVEGAMLLADFAKQMHFPGVTLYPGVSYRNIMVDSHADPAAATEGEPRDWRELVTTPPHDVLGDPMSRHLPHGGQGAGLLQRLIADSEKFLADHPVNKARKAAGKKPATHFWPWGQGRKPEVPSFESRYKLKGAMITAVDLLAGIASFIGWDRLEVPGQTSYHDTDYVAAGQHGIDALDQYDVVCIHIEAPDEASHSGDAATKVAAIEAIDEHVVGPVHQALVQRGEPYRILYLPDHYTLVSTRKHFARPVPFVICGELMRQERTAEFNEANAEAADLHIKHGHELMEYFLYSGLRG